jgi:hypothetical protein
MSLENSTPLSVLWFHSIHPQHVLRSQENKAEGAAHVRPSQVDRSPTILSRRIYSRCDHEKPSKSLVFCKILQPEGP